MYATPVAIPSPAHKAKAPVLQRRCACGGEVGPTGECAACRAKRLQAQHDNHAPQIVHDVVRSSGSPLDPPLRKEMEQRFGHNFQHVRIHTDDRAAKSAASVSASAYTVGSNLVFDRGRFAPHTSEGRQLLAHELAHVTQQSGPIPGRIDIQPATHPLESQANSLSRQVMSRGGGIRPAATAPTVARTFTAGATNCVAGTNGAPADVATVMPEIDTRAGEIASEVATALEASPPDPSAQVALGTRFGLPPVEASGRSMNRLTGAGTADQNAAIAGELQVLARRFRFAARTFTQTIFYRCVGPDGGSSIGGCSITNADCANGSAWSCRGTSAIFMCPQFWTNFPSKDARALVLMHETFHINFGERTGVTGGVGEGKPAGPGGKFRNASCYESFASDITGVPVTDTCPP
jgi:hypothetical protein